MEGYSQPAHQQQGAYNAYPSYRGGGGATAPYSGWRGHRGGQQGDYGYPPHGAGYSPQQQGSYPFQQQPMGSYSTQQLPPQQDAPPAQRHHDAYSPPQQQYAPQGAPPPQGGGYPYVGRGGVYPPRGGYTRRGGYNDGGSAPYGHGGCSGESATPFVHDGYGEGGAVYSARGGYGGEGGAPYRGRGGGYYQEPGQLYGRGNSYHQTPYYGGRGQGFPPRGGRGGYGPRGRFGEEQPYAVHAHYPPQSGYYGVIPNEGFRPHRGARGAFQRGGRGGAGMMPRLVVNVLVHLDDVSKLEELGRKGTMDGIVPQNIISNLLYKAKGSPIRALVVVDKRYIGARMTFPRHPEDVILSQATYTNFLDVFEVIGDDGGRFVNVPNGGNISRHMYNQLAAYVSQLSPFDKPTPEGTVVDPYTTSAKELIADLAKNRRTYDAVEAAMKEVSEASVALFHSLLQEPYVVGGAARPVVAAAEGNNGVGEQTENPDGGEAAPESSPPPLVTPRPTQFRPALLSHPQGLNIFNLSLKHEAKRKAFFELLRVDTPAGEGGPSVSEGLYKTFFAGVLTSQHVFRSFGVRAHQTSASSTDDLTLQSEEVDILCEGFARYGIEVVCANGGSCMLAALTKALRPGYKTCEGLYNRRQLPRGSKRGREESNNETALAHPRSEEDATPSLAAATDDETNMSRTPRCLEEYTVQVAPKDWRFFYAVANAFTMGDLQEQPTAAPLSADEAVMRRAELLTQHIVACRAVQVMIPHFADSVLEAAKSDCHSATSEHVNLCEKLLRTFAMRSKGLMVHSYGNYVAQTLILELSPRAVPGTPVESVLRVVLDIIVDNIFEMSVQKFASNCVERAIMASAGLPDGTQFIVNLARALLSRGGKTMLEVGSQQFGNYVVRHVCERLTAFSSIEATDEMASLLESAKALEKQYYQWLTAHRAELQSTPFGVGLMSWIESQQGRLSSQTPTNS